MVAMYTPHFNASRFYDDDGGEAASTALAAQDTAADVDVSAGDKAFQFRARIDETGGASGSTMDDYPVEYEKNDSGTWVALTTTDTGDGIRAVAAGLTNDAATTDRGTEPISNPGSGSFDAGEQSSDGTVDDMQLTSGNFTEFAYGVEIVAANVADADTFDFRFASSSSVTNNVEPRIDVVKSGATDTPVSSTISAGASVATSRIADYLRSSAVSAGATVAATRIADYVRSSAVSGGAAIAVLVSKTFDIAAAVSGGAAIASTVEFSAGVIATIGAGASVATSRLVDYVRLATVAAGAAVAVVKDIGLSASVAAGPAIAVTRNIAKFATVAGGAAISTIVSLTFDVAAAISAGASVVATNVFNAGSGGAAAATRLVRGVVGRLVRGVVRSLMKSGDQ